MPDLIGRVIGGYSLERELGAGGMGIVFLGRRVDSTADLAAIKVLMPPPQSSADEHAEFRHRFLQEAQLLFQLRHPHILPIHAFGEDQATGYAYMVLPYLDGGTFSDRLKQGPLPLGTAAQYVAQIADALDFAHTRGIVHRDVKPANVLLDRHDQLFLADFGIARLFDTVGGGLTTTGRILGTTAYMSPEQVLGQHVGPAADIYSLGILLYEMVTGRLPFDRPTQAAVMVQHTQQPPPSPRLARPDLPLPAEAAILRALAKRPEERFPSAGALVYVFAEGIQGRVAPMPSAPVSGPYATTPGVEPTFADYTPRPTVRSSSSGTYQSSQRTGQPVRVTQIVLATSVVVIVALLLLNYAPHLGQALFGNLSASPPGSGASATTAPSGVTPDVTSDSGSASACLSRPEFAHAGPASTLATSFVVNPAINQPRVPAPPRSVGYVVQTKDDPAVDGSGMIYHFQIIAVCTPATTTSGVRSFYASQVPQTDGWFQIATFPYAGNPRRACGDPYCWAWGAYGSDVNRYLSLESVKQADSVVLYQLRVGVESPR